MGWKGNLRSFNSAMKKIDRESKRKQKELEKQQKEYEKMEALEQARYEVDVYENYIDRIQSLHKESGQIINWEEVSKGKPPIEPVQEYSKMNKAKHELESFKPNFFQKILGSVEKKKKQLEDKVNNSKIIDEKNYNQSIIQYEKEYQKWEEEVSLSKKILLNDKTSIMKVIKEMGTFSEIEEIGSQLEINFVNDKINIELIVHSNEIIPKEKKSLLSSGKLSIKNLPKGQYNEIYQDYVCSSILRVSREVFALVSVDMIIVTAKDTILDKKTGHKEILPIVSVAVSKKSFEYLNLDAIDPSDSFDNFLHNMNFKKTTGFNSVEKVSI